MADKYLSNTGSNTSPYESASTAANTLQTILGGGVLASGEKIWCKAVPGDLHSETYTAAQTFTSPTWSTAATPARLFCVSDFFESTPPLILAEGAKIITSGAYNMTFSGHWHIYGVRFYPGNKGANGAQIIIETKYSLIENCVFVTPNSTTTIFRIGFTGSSTSTSKCLLRNCYYSPINAGSTINIGKVFLEVDNFRFDTTETGVTAPTSVFKAGSNTPAFNAVFKNSDFSTLAYTNLFTTANASFGIIDFIRCKLRSGANVVDAHVEQMPRVRILDCDSGNTNIRYEVYDSAGVVRTSTTIYPATDPANDGATNYSHVITTNTLASRPNPMHTDWIERWVTGGTPISPYIEVLVGADGGPALTSADLFIEVDYQSDSTSPLGSMVKSAPDAITAGTTLPAGSVSWVGHGFASPVTHKVQIGPITPNKSGFVRARLGLTKASTTVYYDPQIRW